MIAPLEKDEQIAVVAYCKLRSIPISASMNGVFLNSKNANRYINSLKKQGMALGFPDIFIPMPNKTHAGLFIEMKRRKGGVVSDNQNKWIKILNDAGYYAVVCWGFDEARKVIDEYLQN